MTFQKASHPQLRMVQNLPTRRPSFILTQHVCICPTSIPVDLKIIKFLLSICRLLCTILPRMLHHSILSDYVRTTQKIFLKATMCQELTPQLTSVLISLHPKPPEWSQQKRQNMNTNNACILFYSFPVQLKKKKKKE